MSTPIITSFTAEDARALLVRAIEEKGADYVYPRPNAGQCYYFHDTNEPGCLIGTVLAYLGFDSSEVREGCSASENIPGLIPITPMEVTDALFHAQEMQDTGSTWGQALIAFDREIARAAA